MYQGPNQWLKKLRVDKLLDLSKDAANGPQILFRVQSKSANYTCTLADSGTIFTATNANAATTFTLPTTKQKGWFALFVNSVNQSMTIAAGTADTLITFNDTAADSIAFGTNNEKTGACALIVCDGNAYHAVNVGPHTCTVAT